MRRNSFFNIVGCQFDFNACAFLGREFDFGATTSERDLTSQYYHLPRYVFMHFL